jgi:ATP-binding cassette subfamily B protein
VKHAFGTASRIWGILSPARRIQLKVLTVGSIATAGLEAFTVGSILPLLIALNEPGKILESTYGSKIASFFNVTESRQLLTITTAMFCGGILLSCGTRLMVIMAGIKITTGIGSNIGDRMFEIALNRPYEQQTKSNSSEVIDMIFTGVNSVVYDYVLPVTLLITNIALVVAIIVTMFYINFRVALSLFFGVGLIYLSIVILTKSRLRKNGIAEARESEKILRVVQEGLGAIRDIIMSESQPVFQSEYIRSSKALRSVAVSNRILAATPRYVIEASAIILVACLAYFLTDTAGGLNDSLPMLAAFALGTQKLLPASQVIYTSWASLRVSQARINRLLDFLDSNANQKISNREDDEKITFAKTISCRSISYKYPGSDAAALKYITIEILKGSRVGVIGASGSGKSTLVDIVMGLSAPTDGHVYVDDLRLNGKNRKNWRKMIAHVPQSVFLIDSTIAENIAFGIPRSEIDTKRLVKAASDAQIMDYIDAQPMKFDSVVGERGSKLSGGQRQRIGIARALYRNATILVFDEATSALDSATEESIIRSINDLRNDITIIMIAHRLSTLRYCDIVIELRDGFVSRQGNYNDLITTDKS